MKTFSSARDIAVVQRHPNIKQIVDQCGIVNNWLVLPAIYHSMIYMPELSYEEVANEVYQSVDMALLDFSYEAGKDRYGTLLDLCEDVMMSANDFAYDMAMVKDMYVFEAIPMDAHTVGLTFRLTQKHYPAALPPAETKTRVRYNLIDRSTRRMKTTGQSTMTTGRGPRTDDRPTPPKTPPPKHRK